MDDVHRFVVDTGDFRQYLFIITHHFLKVQRVAGQYRDVLYHYRTGVLATSAVDGKQQGFRQVAACAEELDLLSDFLVRHAAGDCVVVRLAHFTHQVVVLVLDGRSVDRNFSTEFFEPFRQFRAPQYSQVRFR